MYQHFNKFIALNLSLYLTIGFLLVTANAQQIDNKKSQPAAAAKNNQAAIEKNETAFGRNFPNIRIRNFGQMDQRFYRGAQPQKDDYQSLKALGVKTVIDLRDDPTAYEKSAVEALGMKYINIPMSDKKYPPAATIAEFLSVANSPQTGVFFVHCEGGRHRTGVVGAVYRMTKYGWGYDQSYQEMKVYDFYTRWGHEAMKDFVVDYAAQLQAHKK